LMLGRDFPLQMKNSDGTGIDLVEEDGFGAGVIRFAPGKGVKSHVHEGDHILKVEKGYGWLIYNEERHRMHPGFVYFVKGNVPHAIEAETELTLFVAGNDYRPMDSDERMTPV